ncbi:MAG: hypothetical protein EBS89_00205 [Proteobacteria bacterium]|nr:hypothetical protein [Pseudomonadota bacterium]
MLAVQHQQTVLVQYLIQSHQLVVELVEDGLLDLPLQDQLAKMVGLVEVVVLSTAPQILHQDILLALEEVGTLHL